MIRWWPFESLRSIGKPVLRPVMGILASFTKLPMHDWFTSTARIQTEWIRCQAKTRTTMYVWLTLAAGERRSPQCGLRIDFGPRMPRRKHGTRVPIGGRWMEITDSVS
jgi:hypothetical protein